jgi:hypothetical protein
LVHFVARCRTPTPNPHPANPVIEIGLRLLDTVRAAGLVRRPQLDFDISLMMQIVGPIEQARQGPIPSIRGSNPTLRYGI